MPSGEDDSHLRHRLPSHSVRHFNYAKDNVKQAVLLSTRQRTHAELVECDTEPSVREQLAVLRSGLLRIPGADTG